MLGQQKHIATLTSSRTEELQFLAFIPDDYDAATNQKWSLILFLHGVGERGNNLDLLTLYGLPKKLLTWPKCPFVVISPQCPADSYWTFHLESLNALVDHVLEHFAVDADRVYLTGLSMGGQGAWQLALAYPHRFAALAPICGRGIPGVAARIKDLPVWAFHGAQDPTVPVSESEKMVEALHACGGNAKLTIYPEVGHNSWDLAYDNPELYEWFLEHHR